MRQTEHDNLQSFEKLIVPHLSAARATARQILGDDDAASDAVQEALITLWQADEAPEHLRRWLLRTVVHRSLHARRSRMRRRRWEDHGGEAVVSCALCDPERELEIQDLIARLDRTLQTLPKDQREILLLRELDGLEYREISEVLGVPIGTVRSRLNRARAHVRATADHD